MPKILVTGANGFVGSFLVEECLRREGLEVYAGIRATSDRSYLQDNRIRFFEFDLQQAGNMADQLAEAKFDYIIHNAGVTAVAERSDYCRVNAAYTEAFLQSLREAGALPRKFTYMSSLAAFGPADTKPEPVVRLDHQPAPLTAYGDSKLEAEGHIRRQSDLNYLIFRPTAVYGPRDKAILTFFQLINRGFEFYIGRREQLLSFVYVKDLARIVVEGTLSETATQKAYFVSDGQAYPATQLGALAREFLERRTLLLRVPVSLVRPIAWLNERLASLRGLYPALNVEKVGELASTNWQCDIEPLQRDLNFVPQYDLRRGLAETLAWYRQRSWL